MSVLELYGARYFAEPGEQVVLTVEPGVADVLGIVTLRPNGLYYASVIERHDYGDGIAEWGEVSRVLSRSIVATADEGARIVRLALSRAFGETK